MIRIFILALGLGLSIIFQACDNTNQAIKQKPILSRFTTAFPKKPINFSRTVNGNLLINNEGSIEEYTLEFYNTDRTTVIINSKGLEVFNGPIYKYRG
ncbi:MAG: hypothetical protein ACPGLV_16800, partial [Bacteroidia bacterium]